MTDLELRRDDTRAAIRAAITAVLVDEFPDLAPAETRSSASEPNAPLGPSRVARTFSMTVTGDTRAITILEQALSMGDTRLQIAVDTQWGPTVRVTGRARENH